MEGSLVDEYELKLYMFGVVVAKLCKC